MIILPWIVMDDDYDDRTDSSSTSSITARSRAMTRLLAM